MLAFLEMFSSCPLRIRKWSDCFIIKNKQTENNYLLVCLISSLHKLILVDDNHVNFLTLSRREYNSSLFIMLWHVCYTHLQDFGSSVSDNAIAEDNATRYMHSFTQFCFFLTKQHLDEGNTTAYIGTLYGTDIFFNKNKLRNEKTVCFSASSSVVCIGKSFAWGRKN